MTEVVAVGDMTDRVAMTNRRLMFTLSRTHTDCDKYKGRGKRNSAIGYLRMKQPFTPVRSFMTPNPYDLGIKGFNLPGIPLITEAINQLIRSQTRGAA